jgi:hypothetical protein
MSTKNKIKNVQTASNTTPSNALKTKQTTLKNLLNLASKSDKELEILKLTMTKVCDDISQYYKGLDIAQFKEKYISDAIKNDIAIRVKGHKNSNTAKPITGTAKTVISNTKKYIDKIGKVDNIPYSKIRKSVNDLAKPTISEKRKNGNKDIAKLSDKQFFEMVNLYLDSKK